MCARVCVNKRGRGRNWERDRKRQEEREGKGTSLGGGAVILVLENFISDIKTSIK